MLNEIEEIKRKLEDHEKRVFELEKLVKKEPEKLMKNMSIKEFMLIKKPKDDVQKTLLIGYYLEKFKNYASFNITDIEKGYRAGKEPVPTNINDKINKNIKKGHIMDHNEKKEGKTAWVVTGRGERFVDNNFKDTKE